jgi:hypothetical protein
VRVKTGDVIWWIGLGAVVSFLLVMLVGSFWPGRIPDWMVGILVGVAAVVSGLVLRVPSKRRQCENQPASTTPPAPERSDPNR